MEKEKGNGFVAMAIGLFVILLAFAAIEYTHFFGVNNTPTSTLSPEATTSTSDNSQIAGWKTYSDDQDGFSLQYPSDFTLTEEPGQSVSLVAPVKNYFSTKLTNEASLTIDNPSKSCDVSDGDKSLATTSSQVVSPAGVFQKISFSDVGAGQLYDTSEYKLEHNGTCYELVLLTHSTNGAGFYYSDPAEIATVDAKQAEDKAIFNNLIDRIVSTFTFTK